MIPEWGFHPEYLDSMQNVVLRSRAKFHVRLDYNPIQRARRVLTVFIDVPLRTRRALSPWTLNSDNAR